VTKYENSGYCCRAEYKIADIVAELNMRIANIVAGLNMM
jgi:hypothetical protein